MESAPDSHIPSAEHGKQRALIDHSLRHPVMFFFTSGAAWLAVSLVLAMIATMKAHSPDFLGNCSALNYGRVFPAHLNTLIYGWGLQAAFGVAIWLMARLSRQESRSSVAILVAGHVWNVLVALGTICILAGKGSGIYWMDFPEFIWAPMLATYAAIAIWSMIHFRVRRWQHIYVSQWFLLGAIIWFPWVFLAANLFVHVFDIHPLMVTASAAWFRSALMLLFFVPIGVAAAFYLVPKITGRAVYNYSLSQVAFWLLAGLAPWAGMQVLMGAPIPTFMPFTSAAATIAVVIPVLALTVSLFKTLKGKAQTVAHSPSLRFTVAGVIGLLSYAIFGAFLARPDMIAITQFTSAGYGLDIVGLYGFFSLTMFGAIYFIVPRITRREWISRRMIRWHFWLSIYGVLTLLGCIALFGSISQGVAQQDWEQPWYSAFMATRPFLIATSIVWGFMLLSNVFFLFHLTLMWLRLGRRSNHPTLLTHDHSATGPHGREGLIDNN
ncbi:cbb3-type cytochrome c oxidase subunit I [Persicirhabdus sediminis]|uniref:Cbb3-type cytochrome c oxidase subunit I n=1 Tax=Persicirhabdus sediminis TaxID=454144 RepID=A0A8J7SLH7_9BACT|nr:cbb3-type cytochrome c oxidase subunit I [Persicirhabdus sediminis]MBK1790398.1 cbb3-type cytochrome c oxidase subunit I [Persicirhabdus sediminis]